MAMIRCPDCGEKYSDTYKTCPFCEEEEALIKDKTIRRGGRAGVSPVTIVLIVLIAVMAALLVFLLKGSKAPAKPSNSKPGTSQQEPAKPGEDIEPAAPLEPSIPVKPESPTPATPSMPEQPSTPAVPASPTEVPAAAPGNKDNKLSKSDVTIGGGESFTLKVTGETASVTWSSDNEAVATVSSSGLVTGVGKGTCNIIAKWDGQSRSCVVRVKSNAAAPTTPTTPSTPSTPTTPSTPSTPTTPSTPSTGGLKLGAGKVANASTGVNVRSGPGTDYDRIASLSVGNRVTIIEDVGNGWYKVTFTATGGVVTEGYIKGDYLSN